MSTPPNLIPEKSFDRAIRFITTPVEIHLLNEGTTRTTTTTDTTTTKQDHHTSQTEVNLGIGAVSVTIHNRLQSQDKTHPSRVPTDNPDQFHLILQCLTDLEAKIRTRIYPTSRSSRS